MLFSVCGISSKLFDEERKGVSKHCRWEAQKRKIKSGGLEEVTTQPIVLFCETGMMLNKLEVGKRRRCDKGVKPSGKQNLAFHAENVFWEIGIVTDIDQVLNLRDLIGLSIFSSYPKGSDAEQLQSRPRHLFFGEIEIDESDHEEIGLPHQFVLLVHFHQPIEQHSSHVLTQLSLLSEVVPHLWATFTQHEAFNLSSVQVLLHSWLLGWFVDDWERLVGWMVLISGDLRLLLGLDLTGLAKFHSNITNEQRNTIIEQEGSS